MRAFSLLLVAPLALASVVQRQSGSATNAGITGISQAVEALTNAVNAYQGGILESAAVFNASLNVHKVNRAAKAAADASPRFTEAESKAIVDNVNSSVGVTIPISVKAIEAKKPYVEASFLCRGVRADVVADCSMLRRLLAWLRLLLICCSMIIGLSPSLLVSLGCWVLGLEGSWKVG